MLRIEIDQTYPHQTLEDCADQIAMLRDLFACASAQNMELSEPALNGMMQHLGAIAVALHQVSDALRPLPGGALAEAA